MYVANGSGLLGIIYKINIGKYSSNKVPFM